MVIIVGALRHVLMARFQQNMDDLQGHLELYYPVA